MGGSNDVDWNKVASKSGPGGPSISGKDFENTTPFKFIVERKKDLKLTDAQVAAFKDADLKLKAANQSKFVLIDSIKKDAKPRTSGDPSAEDMARMALAREALQSVVHDVQTSFDNAAKAALPMLDEPQRAEGQKALDKYNQEMEDMLRERLGGGRSGGPGAGGGRGGRGRGGAV